jgi:hypothetical protein
MIRFKAIAAIALAGLGTATMGADVYMSSRARCRPPAVESAGPLPAAIHAPEVPVIEQNVVVTLAPITVYAWDRSPHARHAQPMAEPPKTPGLEVCSDWRSLEAGPENRNVRTLCNSELSTAMP